MKTKLSLIAIIVISFFISCNLDKENSKVVEADLKEIPGQETNTNDQQQILIGKYQPQSTDSTGLPLTPVVASNPGWDKKMIKTGTLKLEVKNFRNYSSNVHKAIKQFGGYIAQEEQTLTDERTETVISIKVPVEQFENMINQLPGDEDKVIERKITTEDVTADIVDTRSRLEAKKQMRLKYLEFMNHSKNMEEVLQVQNSINNIQEEMESAAGRIQSLSKQSVFSTINLTYYQPATGYIAGNGTPGFWSKAGNAFKDGAAWVSTVLVGIVSVWPLILVAVMIYFGWRRMRTKQSTKNVQLHN
jgi:hypothetical protein